MDSLVPIIDISSDDDDTSDCLISTPSEKRKNTDKVPCCSRKKIKKLPPPPSLALCQKKLLKKNKGQISLNMKIPQATFVMIFPIGIGQTRLYKAKKYLAGKKVIIYGLPSYHTTYRTLEELIAKAKIWRPFCRERVLQPAIDFMSLAETLIGTIDEVLFFTENAPVLGQWVQDQVRREKYNSFKMVADHNVYGSGGTFLDGLGIEKDINENDEIRARSRRFLIIVDNLRVKFVRAESSEGLFLIPTAEEMKAAF